MKKKLTIMVSSSVYGIEELLDRIYAVLTGIGYEVWMSHKGTIPVEAHCTAFDNCIKAVQHCDLFLGLITPHYGSGVSPGDISITHKEIREAIRLRKPRWFLAHDYVVFARKLLNDLNYKGSSGREALKLKDHASAVSDLRVIDMYEESILAEIPNYEDRHGNWVQKYRKDEDALLYAVAQFSRYQEAERFIEENFSQPDKVLNSIEREKFR
ncbi:MAG: hypothetical protein A2X42_06375 [Candidatus Margulisbacteria bacterium GWF2_38_17]|nr:MAG: hypothetical protein A2X42_06375 [Candidatus Margulisbacteria bacterium GWF2_38_17]